MAELLLTIDDSPSPDTDVLTAFLLAENIPAILFCRGDRLQENPAPVIRAVERGFTAANHAFSHRRSSTLSLADMQDEILATEKLLDAAYKKAGQSRSQLYFRFPHMDRGAGGWVVDYDAVPAHCKTLRALFADGLNITLDPPRADQIEKKALLQEFLKAQGFSPLPAAGITHDWYNETECAAAIDAMFTYSTSDWMLTQRHQGKWPYKTLDDLKAKIDQDPWLGRTNSNNIVLAHDQPETLPVVQALLRHLKDKNFSFKPA